MLTCVGLRAGQSDLTQPGEDSRVNAGKGKLQLAVSCNRKLFTRCCHVNEAQLHLPMPDPAIHRADRGQEHHLERERGSLRRP